METDMVSDFQVVELPSVEAGPEIEQFANALDDCLSSRLHESDRRERLLHLPTKYHENATRRLARLRPAVGRSSHDDVDMDTDDADAMGPSPAEAAKIKRLEREAQTWDLLRRVLPLRHADPDAASNMTRLSTVAGRPVPDDSLEAFFLTNSVARERRAVLQWLQTNAASGPDIDHLTREFQQNADRGDIIAHGWLHTRSSIKMKKSVTGWPYLLDRQSANLSTSHTTTAGAPLVTQLDPDASTRQGRKLQPQDEYFERAISLGCFEHLRRGSSLETIRDWCQERTEMWRAVSMSGMLMPADDDGDASFGVEPMSLALWRRMCFSLARQGGSDDYERAIYGILSGDITSVEKVARTWDDFLFAHYNALLRTQLDTFILGHCPSGEASSLTQTFPSFDAVQFHGEGPGMEKRLVRTLEARAGIKDEAAEPNKALQASIIAHDIDEHLHSQALALLSSTSSDAMDVRNRKYFKSGETDGLRIVAHIYVLVTLLRRLDAGRSTSFSQTPRSLNRQDTEEIIGKYAEFLRRARLEELIPVYCSILEPPRRYEILSANLIHEEDTSRRLELLNLIKRANINVLEFVQVQATELYGKVAANSAATFEAKKDFRILEVGESSHLGRVIKADFFGEDPDAVEPEHEHLVRSVEWLLMVTETWPSVFSVGTQVYKFFFRHMHLRAARKMVKKVSFSSIMHDLGVDDDFDEGWFYNTAFWAEQLERSNIHDTTPEKVIVDARNFRELEALAKALDSLETMGAFIDVSKDPAAVAQRDFWSQVGDAIRTTKESMEPLLKQWLLAGIQEGDSELKELRQAYLPETILAYISALQFTGTGLTRDWLLECMNLASLVAQRGSDLEGVFVEAKRVKELLEALAMSSKALAITTGEKRTTGTGNKKLREMGWSRDLWSVKSSQ